MARDSDETEPAADPVGGPASPGAPALDWTEAGSPVSTRYGDVYYSDADGLGETRHVFLRGNGLPERWAGRDRFAIGELGFGVGLNFLATWAAFEADAARPATLHYASLEANPPDADAVRRAIARWPELAQKADALIAADWPPAPGASERTFGPVTLQLWIGDAADAPDDWAPARDAWYLDGFSPAKNPAMWAAPLMRAVAERTAPDGTLATYAAAGWVRRNLLAAGFSMRRTPGFGAKREMLVGRLPEPG